MNLTTAEQPTAVLLERLDAIIDELQVLRQTVQAMQSRPAEINPRKAEPWTGSAGWKAR